MKFLSVGTVASMAGELALRGNDDFLPVVYEDMSTSPAEMLRSIQFMKSQTPDAKSFLLAFQNHDSVVVSASCTVFPHDFTGDHRCERW